MKLPAIKAQNDEGNGKPPKYKYGPKKSGYTSNKCSEYRGPVCKEHIQSTVLICIKFFNKDYE